MNSAFDVKDGLPMWWEIRGWEEHVMFADTDKRSCKADSKYMVWVNVLSRSNLSYCFDACCKFEAVSVLAQDQGFVQSLGSHLHLYAMV